MGRRPSASSFIQRALKGFFTSVQARDPDQFHAWVNFVMEREARVLNGTEWLQRPAVTEARVDLTLPEPILTVEEAAKLRTSRPQSDDNPFADINVTDVKVGNMVAVTCASQKDVRELTKLLTIEEPVPPSVKSRNPYARGKRIKFFMTFGNIVCIPRALGLRHFGLPSVDSRKEGSAWPADKAAPRPPFEPYRAQREVLRGIRECFRQKSGVNMGVIDVPCGMGKTLLAAYTAAAEGGTTWVMVPSTIVQGQFMDFFRTFFPDLEVHALNGDAPTKKAVRGRKVGMWTRDEIVSGAHIVISTPDMIGKLSPKDLAHVRLLIVDECHHIPAETFFHNVCLFSCRRIIGMSATPEKFNVFDRALQWTLGGTIACASRGPVSGAAYQLRYMPVNPAYNPRFEGQTARASYHCARSIMMQDPHRNELLVQAMSKLCAAAQKASFMLKGRRVTPRVLSLVELHKHALGLAGHLGAPIPTSSSRAQQREDEKQASKRVKMPRITEDAAFVSSDSPTESVVPCAQFLCGPRTLPGVVPRLLVGTMDKVSRAESRKEGNLVIATVAMAREGLDLSDVFAVLYGVLEHHTTQIIGRGCRINSNLAETRMVMMKDSGLFEARRIYSDQEATLKDNGWDIVPWDPRKTDLPDITEAGASEVPSDRDSEESPRKRARVTEEEVPVKPVEPKSAGEALQGLLNGAM